MFPNPTENWVQKNVDAQNKAAQEVAAADLAAYEHHVKEWEQAAIQSMYNNVPPPQPPKPPTITQWFIGSGGWAESRVVVNPAAKPPVLPQLPAVTGPNVGIAGPGGSGAGAFDDEVLALLRGNNDMLTAIHRAIGLGPTPVKRLGAKRK